MPRFSMQRSKTAAWLARTEKRRWLCTTALTNLCDTGLDSRKLIRLRSLPVPTAMAHGHQLRLFQFFHVQFSVFVCVETVEFRGHEGHELGPGDLAISVGIHQEQQLLR